MRPITCTAGMNDGYGQRMFVVARSISRRKAATETLMGGRASGTGVVNKPLTRRGLAAGRLRT